MAEITTNDVIALFGAGYNCAQITLTTILSRKGIVLDDAANVAAGFGSGMTNGATCGAVTGAIMAIGLLEKALHNEMVEHKEATYLAVNDFLRQFAAEFGTTVCSMLTGYDWSEPSMRQEARDAGVFQNVCPPLVAKAIEIVLAMYPD
jgi:C_GCAxxG_C_C family probable redox protein